jgi:hypothetical protein
MRSRVPLPLKYSIFAVTALIFYIYFNSPNGISRRRQLLKGTPCIAGLVKLEKKVEKNWKLECVENNLKAKISIKDSPELKDLNKKRTYFFRELANHLVFISVNTPEANLENVKSIHLVLSSETFTVEALTKGEPLSKLRYLTGPASIKEHLKNTVQVKETVKK